MEDKIRCQSCGMPMEAGFFGTNSDNTESNEFCKFCYQQGKFTEPNLTLQDMIAISMRFMVRELDMPEEKAKTLAENIIPTLHRWRN